MTIIKSATMHEFDLIHHYLKPLATHPGALGLTDDAAIMDVPAGQQLIITKDSLCEGVHYVGTEDPALIAQKLLRCNISDLASMGATPTLYFLSLSLPHADETWWQRFAHGLEEDQGHFGLSLGGGDTTRTQGSTTLSLTALGLLPKGTALRRSGAQPGDGLYVSGTLGDAALGLKCWQSNSADTQDFLVNRYLLPQPRVALGNTLRDYASACIDISDGLIQDAGHICSASLCGAEINAASLPHSDAARTYLEKHPHETTTLLRGGDDYELLFTVPPARQHHLATVETPVTRIGTMINGAGVTIYDAANTPIPLDDLKGYRHF